MAKKDQSQSIAGKLKMLVPIARHKQEKNYSGGVGRTGVFIALSIVLERMQYEGVIDLLQTVRILRTQRPAMVQTEVINLSNDF